MAIQLPSWPRFEQALRARHYRRENGYCEKFLVISFNGNGNAIACGIGV